MTRPADRLGAAALAAAVSVLLPGCGSGRGMTPVHTSFNKGVYHEWHYRLWRL